MQISVPQSQARFPTLVKFRAPVGFGQAIAAAARQHHTSASEYVRRLLLREMRRDGVRLSADGRVDTSEAAR
jgi:hypothetical protein